MSAVSANTDFVVVGSLVSGGHSKELDAQRLGITMLTEDEWDDVLSFVGSHAGVSLLFACFRISVDRRDALTDSCLRASYSCIRKTIGT